MGEVESLKPAPTHTESSRVKLNPFESQLSTETELKGIEGYDIMPAMSLPENKFGEMIAINHPITSEQIICYYLNM